MRSIKHFIIFIVINACLNNMLMGEGFVAGTKVKTPTGYIPIEQLKINDKILCYDFSNNYIEKPILYTSKKRVQNYIQIFVGNQCIGTAPNQKIYVSQEKRWINASNITDYLGCNDTIAPCIVHQVDEEIEVYTITVADYHTFCVSTLHIPVHNFAPVISIVAVWIFGEGLEIGITAGIIALGSILGAKLFKRHSAEVALTAGFHEKNNVKDKREHSKSKKEKKKNGKPPKKDDDNSNEKNDNNNQDKNDKQHKKANEDHDKHKERKVNSTSKTEFVKKAKEDYEYLREGIYRKKKNANGMEGAEYLKWDHLHNDVEAYNVSKRHLGSIDPQTEIIYKPAVKNRTIDI